MVRQFFGENAFMLFETLDPRRLLSVSTLQTAWTTASGSASHNAYVSGSSGGQTVSAIWSKTIGASSTYFTPNVAFGDGRIYDVDGTNVTALDPATGQTLWTALTGDGGLSGTTFYRGRLYAQGGGGLLNNDGYLYALDADDGRQIWATTFATQTASFYPPGVNATGVWINGGTYGGVYGFTADGTQITFASLAQVDRWSPSLQDNAVYTYAGLSFRRYTPTGTLVWNYTPSANGWGGGEERLAALAGNSGYLVSNGQLHAVDLTTGLKRWSVATTSIRNPVVANGLVYVATTSGLSAFSETDGTLVRSFAVSGNASNTPVYDPIITDDTAIVSIGNTTRLFNLDGTLRQTLPVGGRLSLDHGSLYVATLAGTLNAYAFGAPIRGIVYNDLNQNGTQDANETGSRDATLGVYLDLDNNGSYSAGDALATNADAGGAVTFNVSPGTYTARLLLPGNAVATTAASASVTVTGTQAATLPAFGVYRGYTVTGRVRADNNADGVADGPNIAARTVYADLNGDGLPNSGEPNAVTNANGSYTLVLPAGDYTLRQVLPAGVVETGRAGGPDALFARLGRVEVAADTPAVQYDFLTRPEQVLTVRLFNDTNANGVQDTGEPLASIASTVYLDANNNGQLDTGELASLTQAGVATFAVSAGAARVRVISADPNRIAFPVDGVTVYVPEGSVSGVSIGMAYGTTLAGSVFEDLDGNGVKSVSEPAFSGAGVTAYVDYDKDGILDSGEPSQLVGPSGQFVFTNVLPGTQLVRLTGLTAAGVQQTAPTNNAGQTVVLAVGQSAAAGAFGVQRVYRVNVAQFNDTNADGIKQPGEGYFNDGWVYADLNNNNVRDPNEPSANPDGTGYLTLPAGTHTLRLEMPLRTRLTARYSTKPVSGSTFATDGRVRVPTDIGAASPQFLFGTRKMAQVYLHQIYDINGDGVYQTGDYETENGGFVYVDLNQNAAYDAGVDLLPDTLVYTRGSFFLEPGTYSIRQSISTGWEATSPPVNVTISPTDLYFTAEFFRRQAKTSITATQIGDGTPQRSRINSYQFTINGWLYTPTIDPEAFSLAKIGDPESEYAAAVSSIQTLPDYRTVITLSLNGPNMRNGSLPDGRYQLLINGQLIRDYNNAPVDARGNGQGGSTRTVGFTVLAGDADGNGRVDFTDFLSLQTSFGKAAGQSGYIAGLDLNGSGVIDFDDFLALQSNFSVTA